MGINLNYLPIPGDISRNQLILQVIYNPVYLVTFRIYTEFRNNPTAP